MSVVVDQKGKPWSPDIGRYVEHRKVWRWDVIGGLALMNGYRVGAELGVSTGRFTIFLCSLIPSMHMICVDLWQEQPENVGAETYTAVNGWRHDKHYEQFNETVRAHFPSRVKIIRDWTTKAAPQVADDSLDFVFIDADHSYEAAMADIRDWTPKVRKGGLIAGHDYSWPGVTQAVTETGRHFRGADDVWFRFAL